MLAWQGSSIGHGMKAFEALTTPAYKNAMSSLLPSSMRRRCTDWLHYGHNCTSRSFAFGIWRPLIDGRTHYSKGVCSHWMLGYSPCIVLTADAHITFFFFFFFFQDCRSCRHALKDRSSASSGSERWKDASIWLPSFRILSQRRGVRAFF